MSWTYQQSTGILRDRRGVVAGVGYSGIGACRNFPAAQTLANQGPIPQGLWDVIGPPEDTVEDGPYVLRLQPYIDNKSFDRDGFLIRGESAQSLGMVSTRGIVMALVVRREIWESNDHVLEVIT
jgi:hypothetical protein